MDCVQGQINDEEGGMSGIPSQIWRAILNSKPGISSPREGIGVVLSHALVSRLAGIGLWIMPASVDLTFSSNFPSWFNIILGGTVRIK